MKNNRSSHQTARHGWKPKRTSDAKLASDIIESIKAHAAVGVRKIAEDYTQRQEIIERVNNIIAK